MIVFDFWERILLMALIQMHYVTRVLLNNLTQYNDLLYPALELITLTGFTAYRFVES